MKNLPKNAINSTNAKRLYTTLKDNLNILDYVSSAKLNAKSDEEFEEFNMQEFGLLMDNGSICKKLNSIVETMDKKHPEYFETKRFRDLAFEKAQPLVVE